MTSVHLAMILYCLLAPRATAATIGEPGKPHQDLPGDRGREQVIEITGGRHEYTIPFGGAVDGTMTRPPIGYSAVAQKWEPNRSVLIENVGEECVRNPWLTVNGRGDWRNLASIVAGATRGFSSDSDKARAIWEFVRRQRFHACTWDNECSDAVKALNVYGYTLCGDQALVLNDLWRAAGLETRRGHPVGHVVGEVFYDGRFHMLDSDEHIICLLRDNQTIASEEEIVADHDLIKRTHAYGIGSEDSRKTDEFSASLYGYEGKRGRTFPPEARHVMEMELRPGESFEFRWDHVGKQYTAGIAPAHGVKLRDGLGDLLKGWGPVAYGNLRNGRLSYHPPLHGAAAARGTKEFANIIWDSAAGTLRTDAPDRPAWAIWKFASPYVFVGGHAAATLDSPGEGHAEWRFSSDGKEWTTLGNHPPDTNKADAASAPASMRSVQASLDDPLSPRGHPTYAFLLQLYLHGRLTVRDIEFRHDVQHSALGAPHLTVGDNRILYTDDTVGKRHVRITHRWVERNAWHPPTPPAEATAPRDGAVVEGTRVRFAWNPATDPDGDAIADYHIEISLYEDMRWPLSPNFERLISKTPDAGKCEWTVPVVGLLNPDTIYYWHVRAKDARGVWGPWSRAFSFRCRAPGVPLDPRLSPDPNGDGFVLSWRPNPNGAMPARYKVYGSDEKGFSIGDEDHVVFRGKGFVRDFDEYLSKPANAPDSNLAKTPANLFATTTECRLRVVGSNLSAPCANRAFYRVVAVDPAGVESGPSDMAEVARPYVYSRPPRSNRGAAYRYQPLVITSIGDLRCRPNKDSSYNAAFWDREECTFQANRLPPDLTLDPKTGLIEGILGATGGSSIEFTVRTTHNRSITVIQDIPTAP